MPSAHAITIFWRIFTVVGLSILTVHILNVALGRESGRTSAPCPSLSHVFPEYAALSIRPQDAVAVIAEEKCGKRLARELRRALACNRVEVYTSEENLSRRTYDAVLIYGAGTHDAYRGLRAGIRVSKRLVAVWAQVSGAAQQQLMASVTPLDVSFVAATRHGIAITAELKDLAAAQRSRAVDILGHGSSGGAGTRYFLVWTTDAKGWGLLRWLVIERLVRVVPNAEIFVFANHLPENHFHAHPNVRLVRYDEVALFQQTPLASWAAHMDQWRQGPYFYSHFSDAFRVAVLWRWGGHYLDTDVLLLRPLTSITNALGAEALRRPEDPTWRECLFGHAPGIDDLYDVNLAIASFDAGAPFLYYVMRRLVQTYDATVWNSAGPGLVRVCLGEWQRFDTRLVRSIAAVGKSSGAEAMGGTVTVFTDNMVYYPVSWSDALAATQAKHYDPHMLAAVQNRSYAYHVYTQMFKISNASFAIESDSLLDHLLTATDQ